MDKLSNKLEKLKIKAKPKRYETLKQTCKKLQAIIDRRLVYEEKNKTPSYIDELYFYSIFIPDLMLEMQEHDRKSEDGKMIILKKKISIWTKANIVNCAKYISVFDKGHITDDSPGTPGTPGTSGTLGSSRRAYLGTPGGKSSPVRRKSSTSRK